jgi:hypothetical protein
MIHHRDTEHTEVSFFPENREMPILQNISYVSISDSSMEASFCLSVSLRQTKRDFSASSVSLW